MNIVFILPSLEKIAPVTVLVNIISYLVLQKDHTIQIITLQETPKGNYTDELLALGIIVHEYTGIKEAYNDKDDRFWNAVDVLHINSLKPNILAYFLQKKYKHLKSLVTIHSVEKIDYVQSRGFLKGNFSYRLNAYLCKQRHYVVAVSSEVRNYLESMNISNVKLIHNGINFEKFKTFDIAKDEHVIDLVQVGVININKNQFYSLELLHYLLNQGLSIRLHIVGGVKDHAYKEKLDNYIVKNNLEQEVLFYGNQDFLELTKTLSSKDILLMPSYSEGLPLSPLEGYFYGLPAITSSNGGLKEVNIEGKTGIFVNIESDESFDKVFVFIKEKRYKKISKNVKAYTLENFHSKKMAKKYIELYTSL